MLAALLASAALAGTPAAPVCIDPGHGARANPATEPIGPGSATRKLKDGGGAGGVVTGQREADLALDVSLRLRALLRREGIPVVMTRTTTRGPSLGNVTRARTCNRAGAALMLRVHADGSSNRATHGTHTLVPARRRGWTDDIAAESRRAGTAVQRALVARLGSRNLGLQERGDITGFNWADVPAVLVELGFLTNPREDRLLATPAYRARAAAGLRDGIRAFLGR
ncbi:MAG TPA: N-acetylmuramoyl-L-alanine amidase [Gaiellaceae bacterium]|nr:N-acetylmuramoyl-L-alanine amidase [Gaiellaceae bacterium]